MRRGDKGFRGGKVERVESVPFPTLSTQPNTRNLIPSLYSSLFGQLSSEYPQLSKAVFLCLLLRTSATIHTPHPQEVKDIYQHICSRLSLKQRIYHCDNDTFSTDVFKSKSPEDIHLLFGVMRIDNKRMNEMTEHLSTSVVINVETPNPHAVEPHNNTNFLSRQFGLHIHDTSKNNFKEFVSKLEQKKLHRKMDPKMYRQSISNSLKMGKEMAHSGFIKTYLEAVEERLEGEGLGFPHSRWKKAYEHIKVIGLNKCSDEFKSLALCDCVFVPLFLATSVPELAKLSEINVGVITKMAEYYGVHKFLKQLETHLWIDEETKKVYNEVLNSRIDQPSFFFPCSKYPNLVTLEYEQGESGDKETSFFYRVCGSRKLMSDKYTQVDQSKEYTLQMDIRAKEEAEVEVGITCYDSNRHCIHDKKGESKQHTQVVVSAISPSAIVVEQNQREILKNWNSPDDTQDKDDHLFCLGLYNEDNSEPFCILSAGELDSSSAKCSYTRISHDTGQIILAQQLREKVQELIKSKKIVAGKTIAKNYVKHPSSYSQRVKLTASWQSFSMICGPKSSLLETPFWPLTDTVRVVVETMESPSLKAPTNQQFCFKNITFTESK